MTAHAADEQDWPPDWRSVLAAAVEAHQRGELDEAMRLAEQARALAPDEPEPYLAGARILVAQGSRDQARQFLRIALHRQPGRVDASLELAALEPDPARAETVLRQANAEHPDDLDVMLALGDRLRRQGRAAAAVELLEQVIAQRPRDVIALQALGDGLLGLQRDADAVVQFEASLRADPGDLPRITSLFGLARAHLVGRRFVDAEATSSAMLRQVADLRERYSGAGIEDELETMEAGANYLLASALVGRQRLDHAYDRFRAASRCEATRVIATAAEAAVQQRRGQYAASWPRLAELPRLVLEHARNRPDGRPETTETSMGVMAAIELGELQQAQRLLDGGPDNEVICSALGALALARRDGWSTDGHEPDLQQQAIAHIERAELHVDKRTELRGAIDPDVEAVLAGLLLAVDDTRRATTRVTSALELAPRHPALLTAQGIVRARSDDPKGAAEAFRAALREDPGDVAVKVRLGHALLRLGLLAPAEAEYRAVLRRARGCIEAHAGLGQVLVSLGDAGHPDAWAEAVDAFEKALQLAATMDDAPERRYGSMRVGPAQRSALEYGHGLALARLYELRRDVRLLRRAHAAFERANASPQAHPHAERAARLTAVRLADVRGLIEDVGRWLLLVVTLLLLVAVQLSFFAGWPSADVDKTTYGVLTPLLLGFVVVALTLPQMRSLRLAGLELQKTAEARLADFEPLRLMRDDWVFDAQHPALTSLAMPTPVEDEPPSELASHGKRAAEAGKSTLEPRRPGE